MNIENISHPFSSIKEDKHSRIFIVISIMPVMPPCLHCMETETMYVGEMVGLADFVSDLAACQQLCHDDAACNYYRCTHDASAGTVEGAAGRQAATARGNGKRQPPAPPRQQPLATPRQQPPAPPRLLPPAPPRLQPPAPTRQLPPAPPRLHPPAPPRL